MRAQIGTIILATSFVQLALGFFGTFLSLRVELEQFDEASTGLVLSSYFAGFAAGAVRCGAMIERIGTIRAYAALAGSVIVATALMPVWIHPLPWIAARAIVGFGCAGLFVVTESWLNAKAPPALRGRVFSIYMVGTFVALALGQLLIVKADVSSARPFNVLAALFAFAIVLVGLTRAEAPLMARESKLAYGELARAAPLAVGGVAVAGFVASCFYALVPAWMQGVGVPQASIGYIMLGAVLGGLAFQIPIGQLSDMVDRRLVLAFIAIGFAIAAVMIVKLPHSLVAILPAAIVLGGFMSTLYPVSAAHAFDRMDADRVVSVSSRLILINGLGSILGPLIGTSLMKRFEIDGVLYLMAFAAAALCAFALIQRIASPSARRPARPFEILDPLAAAHASGEGEALPTHSKGGAY
jgi:MFS family permease